MRGEEGEKRGGARGGIERKAAAIHREKTLSRARARREHRVVNLSRANNPRARPPSAPPPSRAHPFELFIFLMGFNFVETT